MIAFKKIDEIVGKVVFSNLTGEKVERVESGPTVDSEGQAALRIMIVLKPGVVENLDGDTLLDTLVEIQHSLLKAGEDRFPIVEYATQAELDEFDDPES